MKKICLILTLGTFLSFSSKAQELKAFKVDVSMGYAIPGGSGAKGGILFAIEPKYSVMPALSVGLRMEGAIIARFGGWDQDGNATDGAVKASGSYLATADYYLRSNYSFRPFVGAGMGIYSIAAAEINSSAESISSGSKFGGMIRAGVELSHFRLGLEYNLVPQTEFSGYNAAGDPATIQSKNGYIGIKLGVCIGGGRKSSNK